MRLITYHCEHCEQDFQSQERKDRVVRFCSRECSRAAHPGRQREDGTKLCAGCKELKPISEYTPLKHAPQRLVSRCRECVKLGTRAKRAADPQKAQEERRQYYEANKEHIHQKAKEWIAANPENPSNFLTNGVCLYQWNPK